MILRPALLVLLASAQLMPVDAPASVDNGIPSLLTMPGRGGSKPRV